MICHGAVDDGAQAARFAPAAATATAALDQVIFADQTHAALVPHLKARGCLAGMLAAGLDKDRRRMLRIAASAGGVTRAKFERGTQA